MKDSKQTAGQRTADPVQVVLGLFVAESARLNQAAFDMHSALWSNTVEGLQRLGFTSKEATDLLLPYDLPLAG